MASVQIYQGNGFVELASAPDPSATLFSVSQAMAVNVLITSEFNTWKTVAFSVDCFSPSWYSKTILPLRQNNSPIYFRMGIQNGNNSVYTQWEKHILIGSSQDPVSSLEGAPTKVYLTTGDYLCFMAVGDKTVVRKGTISGIVSNIASANQISVSVEPTTDPFTLYQVYQSDYRFILDRLLPRAINGSGYGDYKLFIDNGTLHFATLDYQAGTPLAINYTSSLGPGPTFVYDLKFGDKVWTQFIEGSAGAAATIGDPYDAGQIAILSNNPDSTLSFGGASAVPQPASTFQALMARHRGENPVSEIAAQAQNKFSTARNQQYNAKFSIDNNPFISLSTLVSIQVNQTYDYSGIYAIAGAKHLLKAGMFKSTYFAIRDSSQALSGGSPSLVLGSGTAGQPFGGAPQSIGTAPRIGQTTVLPATNSTQTINVPISSNT